MPKSFIRSYWMTVLLCVVIFILSTITFKEIPNVAKFKNSDKMTHILMYIVLGFIFYYEFIKDNVLKSKFKNWFWIVFVILVAFGGIIEILQGTIFKPRTAEFMDWIADIVGLLIGSGVGKIIFSNLKPFMNNKNKSEL